MKIEWGQKYRFVPSVPEPIPNWALTELVAELRRMGVDVDTNLVGKADAFPDGGWCIHQEDEVWLVYRSERGRRSSPAIFVSAFDAANFYLWKHIADPSADNSSVGLLPRRRK